MVFCNNINGLLVPEEVCHVHLHIGKKYESIPIEHSTKMKEECKTISLVLKNIEFDQRQRPFCVDFKMMNFFLRQECLYIISLFSVFLGSPLE